MKSPSDDIYLRIISLLFSFNWDGIYVKESTDNTAVIVKSSSVQPSSCDANIQLDKEGLRGNVANNLPFGVI